MSSIIDSDYPGSLEQLFMGQISDAIKHSFWRLGNMKMWTKLSLSALLQVVTPLFSF